MDVGTALQLAAAAAATLGVAAASAGRRIELWPRIALTALGVAAVACVAAALRVGMLGVGRRYEFAHVASNVDDSMSLPLRIASAWAGAEGSLVVFTAIVGLVLVAALALGSRDDAVDTRHDMLMAGVTIGALTATSLLAAPAFESSTPTPLDGEGISPILDHWAMIVHPPLLYLGLALALVPALTTDAIRRRRATHVALVVLTLALGLGSGWAYVELGWGGWWAWDPVENVGLVVWLLLVAAIHAPSGRWATGLLAAAWPAVVAGSALTRTSLRTSVHAFADAGGIGWGLWPLTAVVSLGAIRWIRGSRATPIPRRTRVAVIALTSAAVIVAAGTYRPFLDGATAGWFYTRLLAPIVVVGAVAMSATGRRAGRTTRKLVVDGITAALAGGLIAAAVGADLVQATLIVAVAVSVITQAVDVRMSAARTVGHLGILLVIVAAVAGTFATRTTLRLLDDGSTIIAGHTIRLLDVEVTDDPRDVTDTIIVTAIMTIDGQRAEPSIGIHPARGLRLANAATSMTVEGDVQILLRDADDESVRIDVNVQPLQWTAWMGASLLAIAFVIGAAGRPTAVQSSPRLRRSSSSMVDGGASATGGGGGSGAVGGPADEG